MQEIRSIPARADRLERTLGQRIEGLHRRERPPNDSPERAIRGMGCRPRHGVELPRPVVSIRGEVLAGLEHGLRHRSSSEGHASRHGRVRAVRRGRDAAVRSASSIRVPSRGPSSPRSQTASRVFPVFSKCFASVTLKARTGRLALTQRLEGIEQLPASDPLAVHRSERDVHARPIWHHRRTVQARHPGRIVVAPLVAEHGRDSWRASDGQDAAREHWPSTRSSISTAPRFSCDNLPISRLTPDSP